MRAWKPILVAIVTMNVESTKAIHALKLLESVERDFAGAGDKLEQLSSLFLVKGANSTPEPLDLR